MNWDYGDYQSPHSADVYRLIRAIQRQLTVSFGEDYLCFIFRHFSQTPLYPHAQRAAEAAEAAAAQGQFWQMHEMLFDRQSALSNGYLIEYANELELNMSRFLQNLSRQVYSSHVNEDIAGACKSGVTVAPTLFINGIRYSNCWNIEQLTTAIVKANN